MEISEAAVPTDESDISISPYIMEISEAAVPIDEIDIIISPFEMAKKRINDALKCFNESKTLTTRSPCTIFDGCQVGQISDDNMETVQNLFLHLCSTQDQRRWSRKSSYESKSSDSSKGLRAYRGVCSRSGTQFNKLIRRNGRTSSKCNCKASFTIFSDGKVVFKNTHAELCLPDTDLGNDGYVFNSGLSPSKKTTIIANVSDLLNDYSTTPAAARKQIERSLVKSGDTGFAAGQVILWILTFSKMCVTVKI